MAPLLRYIWVRVVVVRHRRPRRRHLRRHKKKTKRRQARMHVRTHKKLMWVETQEDTKKGVTWRGTWRDAFGETKWRSRVEVDTVGNTPGDDLSEWGVPCQRRALWGDCRLWRNPCWGRDTPERTETYGEAQVEIPFPTTVSRQMRG